nr:hypothetical protein Iba_chr04aCG9720 [Ipomoea batatas]
MYRRIRYLKLEHVGHAGSFPSIGWKILWHGIILWSSAEIHCFEHIVVIV